MAFWPPGYSLPQPGRQTPTPLPTTPIRRPRLTAREACLLRCLLLGPVRRATAQGDVCLSGQSFIDYYQITSPDEAEERLNGFTYRRFHLTSDAEVPDAFSARLRLDAQASSFGDKGPQPFVKDLYLAWNVGGRSLRMGVTPSPVFQVTERVWGYRGLAQSLLDLNDVVSSRDFGVCANGSLGTDRVRYGGPPEDQLVVSAVADFVTDTWRYDAEGGSLFGDVRFEPRWGLAGRVVVFTVRPSSSPRPARAGSVRLHVRPRRRRLLPDRGRPPHARGARRRGRRRPGRCSGALHRPLRLLTPAGAGFPHSHHLRHP